MINTLDLSHVDYIIGADIIFWHECVYSLVNIIYLDTYIKIIFREISEFKNYNSKSPKMFVSRKLGLLNNERE